MMKWYGEDVLFQIHTRVLWSGCLVLDSYDDGMERMSCFIFIS